MSDQTQTSTPPDDVPASTRGEVPGAARTMRLRLPAVPANVALVRQALAGFMDSLGLGGERAADMKIAITEACTNAVVHAYGDEGGPLEVTMTAEDHGLVLTVRDRGHGLRPFPAATDGPPLGFGLALIASLSDEFGIAGGRHGTEVRMTFAAGDGDGAAHRPLAVQVPPQEAWPANDTMLSLASDAHAATVLSRVVSLVAARADFSIDRLSDAQIVSDAVAGAAGPHTHDGTLHIVIAEQDGSFDLVVGPLVPDGGQQLIRDTDLPGLGSLLERLSDGLAIEPLTEAQAGEMLRVTMGTRA